MTRKKKRKIESARLNVDRLSNLPDELITHILGCMDIKQAVQTCVLSKRWRRGLWEYLPTLNIYSESFNTTELFEIFVSRLVENYKACSVNSLSLHNSKVMKSNQLLALRVIDRVVSRGVQHVCLTSTIWNTSVHNSAASCLLASKSLRSLNLEKCRVYVTPCCFRFPYLKTLSLYKVKLEKASRAPVDVLSICVSLENLELRECNMVYFGDLTISCPQLVNLEVSFTTGRLMILNAPKLTSFKLKVYGPNRNFFKLLGILNSPGLHTIDFHSSRSISRTPNSKDDLARQYTVKLSNLFQKLRTAKSFNISTETIKNASKIIGKLLFEHNHQW
ncbi:hypothetical protein ACFE04_009190 [Oxalis oulophora]